MLLVPKPTSTHDIHQKFNLSITSKVLSSLNAMDMVESNGDEQQNSQANRSGNFRNGTGNSKGSKDSNHDGANSNNGETNGVKSDEQDRDRDNGDDDIVSFQQCIITKVEYDLKGKKECGECFILDICHFTYS